MNAIKRDTFRPLVFTWQLNQDIHRAILVLQLSFPSDFFFHYRR